MTDLTTAPIATSIETADITMLVRNVDGVDTLYQVPASLIQGETGPEGPTGVVGPAGPQGTRGSLWYYGSGAPSSTITPNNDDMYYNSTTGDVYNFSNSKWSVVGNIKGLTGDTGIAGTYWYFGKGSPIVETAKNGDIYLDESTGNLYQYDNVWTSTSSNIIGPTGPQGTRGLQGTRGSLWYYGSGSPTLTSINSNDLYLDISSSNVYQYINTSWSKIANIQGQTGNTGSQWYVGSGSPVAGSPYIKNDMFLNASTSDVFQYDGSSWAKMANIQGSIGSTGAIGATGPAGPKGSIWYYGNVSPPTVTTASEYDMYLDGILGNVYQYLSSTWAKAGNIKGPNGNFTNDGSEDIKVASLTTYSSGPLKFMSDGDNRTIDSSIIPSGGISGTANKGTITLSAGTVALDSNLSVSGSSSLDNGAITTDGSGNMEVAGLNINVDNLGIGSAKMASDTTVTGQGIELGWNLDGGDAWTYFTNVVPSSTYSGSGFYWQTVVNGDKITSATKTMSLDGNGLLTVAGLSVGSNFQILQETDSKNNSGNIIKFKDTSHVDVFGGKLASDSSFDFSNSNVRSFYVWPSGPSGEFVFGFASSTAVDSVIFTQSTSTFNTDLVVTGSSSLDNGKITTDGSGNVTFTGTTIVSPVTDWTTYQAVGAKDSDSRYIISNQDSSTNYRIESASIIKSSGAISVNTSNGVYSMQPFGDYVTTTTFNSYINQNLLTTSSPTFAEITSKLVNFDNGGNSSIYQDSNKSDVVIHTNNGTDHYSIFNPDGSVELGGDLTCGSITSDGNLKAGTSSAVYTNNISSYGGTVSVNATLAGAIGYSFNLIGSTNTANTSSGAFNTSSTLNMFVTQRTNNYYTSQYAEEQVGTEVRHVLYVQGQDSSGNNTGYNFVFSQAGRFDCNQTYADYGDLAELYASKENYKPGTFVKITEDEVDYEIEAAICDDFIFGVISTNPGLLINSKYKGENGLPVALTGRVPALIVGPISKGRPVILSNIEGVGKQGVKGDCIIGFALETNLNDGIKSVEIAIGGRS